MNRDDDVALTDKETREFCRLCRKIGNEGEIARLAKDALATKPRRGPKGWRYGDDFALWHAARLEQVLGFGCDEAIEKSADLLWIEVERLRSEAIRAKQEKPFLPATNKEAWVRRLKDHTKGFETVSGLVGKLGIRLFIPPLTEQDGELYASFDKFGRSAGTDRA